MAEYDVQQRAAPPSASAARRGSRIDLIVLHSDLGSAFESLTNFTARGSTFAPHFYVAADGTITQLVPYKRAAHHSGRARWKNRVRNIDTNSVGVMLEYQLDGHAHAAQIEALHWLLDRLLIYYNLEEDAIMRWQPPVGDKQLGKLVHYVPPQPPAPPPVVVSRGMVLGDEDDPQAVQRLWLFLQDQTYKQRGGAYHIDWSFHLHAAKFDLGAPMAPSDPNQLQVDGSYGYQPFARDTICNKGREWTAVQNLSALPEGNLRRALIDASYRTSLAASAGRVALKGNQAYHPEWKFHQVALAERLGPPISGNYATADGAYAMQVFASDTLYTPRAEITGCRRLSQTAPGDPAYMPMWAETYASIGGAYDPNSPFQQFAAANKLGSPLGAVAQAPFEGTSYNVQVFALDTIYAGPDGAIKRLSALPKPAAVAGWQPAAPTADQPPPTNQPSGNAPDRVRRLVNQAISLLGTDAADLANHPEIRKYVPDSDIVCADLVTICLSEIGVKLWGDVTDPTRSGRTGRRAANYYRPDQANQGMLRALANDAPWLPGDIMIYGKGDLSVDRAYHVNLFVGPFSYQGRARDVVNASLGDPTVIALNKDRCMETHCSTDYKWTQRVRIVELEKEFA